MAEIDQYKHTCLGIIECPSVYPIVYGNDTHRSIPIYRLDEAAFGAKSIKPDRAGGRYFEGKTGDILLGGGYGGSAAFRLAIPESIYWLTNSEWADRYDGIYSDLMYAYWSVNQAYIFGEGYQKLGWNPCAVDLKIWLAEHITSFLARIYPQAYAQYFLGDNVYDGSICRLPTKEEQALC